MAGKHPVKVMARLVNILLRGPAPQPGEHVHEALHGLSHHYQSIVEGHRTGPGTHRQRALGPRARHRGGRLSLALRQQPVALFDHVRERVLRVQAFADA